MTLIDYTHLSALLAVERAGSFEGAGKLLRISAIGVSRRITKFEAALGAQLLKRKPTRTTDAGKALCRYAARIEALETGLLEESVARGLQGADAEGRIRIVLSTDSLSDWFRPVLAEHSPLASDAGDKRLEITVANPDCSLELMRTGEAVAALTTNKLPVHGFRSHAIGSQDYLAVATPSFAEKHFQDGLSLEAFANAPALRSGNRDTLALDWVEQITGEPAGFIACKLPSQVAVIRQCLSGKVWAMLPASSIRNELADGTLIELRSDAPLIISFYWHVARIMVETLSDLTTAIRTAAKQDGMRVDTSSR